MACKRRDKGVHSEAPYGEGNDRGEGFPFWATTWLRALQDAAKNEAVVAEMYAIAAWVFQEAAAELTQVSNCFAQPSFLSSAFKSSPLLNNHRVQFKSLETKSSAPNPCAVHLHNAADLSLLHDSRAGRVLVLYSQCQKVGDPAMDQIREVMQMRGKGKEPRKLRNADAGHIFL